MTVGVLFYFASFGVVVAITAQYFSSKAAVGFTREMTKDLYEKILSLPKDKRDRIGTSSLVTRLTSDTYQIQVGINQFLRLFWEHRLLSLVLSSWPSPSVLNSLFGFGDGGDFNPWLLWSCLGLSIRSFAKIRKITDRMVTVTRQQFQRDAGDSSLWTASEWIGRNLKKSIRTTRSGKFVLVSGLVWWVPWPSLWSIRP